MRPLILRCREKLSAGRDRARRSHDAGTPGRQIATLLSNLYDDIVTETFDDALQTALRDGGHPKSIKKISLVAHGGYGRCDVSPYSDADLMLLTTRGGENLAAEIAGHMTRDLGDIGIDPGLAIRRDREACQLSWADPRVFTSLTEMRLIGGSVSRYNAFYDRFRRGAMRRQKRIIAVVVEARREERRRWGESAYMLRPNVKRSRGGLRDVQSIRWIGFAKHGESDLTRLVRLGLLPTEDYRLVQMAYDFFLSLRHELHFRTGKAADVLDRHLQMDIAKNWGYADRDGALAVEQFMQDYFENARNVRYAAAYCVEELSQRSGVGRAAEWLRSVHLRDDILMGPTRIWVTAEAEPEFATSLPKVLTLMALANEHDRRIDHQTWRAIRGAVKSRQMHLGNLQTELVPEGIEAFKTLMDRPSRLAPLLRRMHDLRVIEWLIPMFGRIRGMLQFNAYHKYTVDAHSIRAVEAATSFGDEAAENEPADLLAGIRRRYGRIEPKWLLHLTLLIHDIGKGFEEDHCVVGERMAIEIGQRLEMTDEQTDMMAWLVRHHLIVNDCAFRHDLSDPQIVLEFAKEVGTIRRLEWLVVHTVADLMAVGPEVATDWKLRLIEDLYRRTRRYFDSQSLPGSPDDPELESQRRRVASMLSSIDPPAAVRGLVDQLPPSLLLRHRAEDLIETVTALDSLPDESTIWCGGALDPTAPGTVHFKVVRREEQLAIGTFARAAGVMSALGLTIRRAQVERLDAFSWNDFWVADLLAPDDSVDPERIERTTRRIESLLNQDDGSVPPPPRRWSTGPADPKVNVMPSKVTFDNDTIDRFTILSLFAYDSPSLLHRVTTVLAEHALVLQFAKIDTHFDQVADVFYVTTTDGGRLTDPDRQQRVRGAILEVVSEELETELV